MPIKMRYAALILFLLIVIASCRSSESDENKSWQVYGGSKENTRYSSLKQIDTSNVAQLKVAWTFNTGDAGDMTQIQVNPIIIDGILYGVSPKLKLFAAGCGNRKREMGV